MNMRVICVLGLQWAIGMTAMSRSVSSRADAAQARDSVGRVEVLVLRFGELARGCSLLR